VTLARKDRRQGRGGGGSRAFEDPLTSEDETRAEVFDDLGLFGNLHGPVGVHDQPLVGVVGVMQTVDQDELHLESTFGRCYF